MKTARRLKIKKIPFYYTDNTALPNKKVTRVIIIGAGISGISAANALKSAGIETVILEARNRIGGRIHTIQLENIVADAGGSWIHAPEGNPLWKLTKALSLQSKKFSIDTIFSDMRIVDLSGTPLSLAQKTIISSLSNTIESEIMGSAKDYPAGTTLYEALEDRLKIIDNYETRNWVRFHLETGLQADLAASSQDISLENYCIEQIYDGEDHCITGGYSKLTNSLAENLDIHTNCIIKEITQTNDKVIVKCTNNRVEIASHVLLTVPLGVLKNKSINFNPPLPLRKISAIDRIGFGAFEKILLQFKEPFWRRKHKNLSGILIKDHPSLPYWIDITEVVGSPTLAAHITGYSAHELCKLSDQCVINLSRKALKAALSMEIPSPIASHRTNWLNDPFSRGAYMHLNPTSTIDDISTLSEPFGRVLFAGEATSPNRFGYVDGAFSSGLREAKRLLNNSKLNLSINTLISRPDSTDRSSSDVVSQTLER